MFNLWWGILFVLVTYTLFVLCYRLFGIKGIYGWIAIAAILANIQVIKTIDLVGVVTTLGNTLYVSMYLASDLLNERFGPQVARRAVWFGFLTLIITTIVMQMALQFEVAPGVDISADAQSALELIFGQVSILLIASLTAYLVSQLLDVRLYRWLRRSFPKPEQLWIRNNGSTMISSFVDTLIFCTIAFLGIYDWSVWLQILFTTYILKFILTAAGTPFLYWARTFKAPAEDQPLLLRHGSAHSEAEREWT